MFFIEINRLFTKLGNETEFEPIIVLLAKVGELWRFLAIFYGAAMRE